MSLLPSFAPTVATRMEAFLFRHGPAEDRDPQRWPADTDRPLSPEGVRATRRAARGFAAWVGRIDRIATSPFERADATAHILSRVYPRAVKVERWEELASGELAAPLLARVRGRPRSVERIALVGHEPTLGEFAGYALTGESVAFLRLSKAGAAGLGFPRALAPGAAQLLWVLTREQLTALAK
jgi:phosphohistidine phosphatase